MDQVGNAAEKPFLGRALMWTLFQVCCSLSPIWDPRDRSTYEVVSVSIGRAEYGKCCGRMTLLGSLHKAQEVFLDHGFYMCSDLVWQGEETVGSLGPFSWLRYFIHYHHRLTYNRRIQEKLKGGRGDSESAREKEVKSRRKRGKELWIQATGNVIIIATRKCLGLRWISHKWDKPAHLYQSFLSFLAWRQGMLHMLIVYWYYDCMLILN